MLLQASVWKLESISKVITHFDSFQDVSTHRKIQGVPSPGSKRRMYLGVHKFLQQRPVESDSRTKTK